jgi:hypothetical protein
LVAKRQTGTERQKATVFALGFKSDVLRSKIFQVLQKYLKLKEQHPCKAQNVLIGLLAPSTFLPVEHLRNFPLITIM